jgi:spermidine/putrescine-binding protein
MKDWKDLFRPELAGKVTMVDSPREVVGAVLKSLGASYNTKDFDKEVPGGREAVKE